MKSTTAHDADAIPDDGERNEHPLMVAVRLWDRFWFSPADPTSLGLMRISAGLVVLYIHLIYSIGLTGYVGPDTWVLNKGWTDKPGESGVNDFLRNGNTWQAPARPGTIWMARSSRARRCGRSTFTSRTRPGSG